MTEFRKAGPSDVPELSRLARSAYAVYQPRMRRPPAPVTADYAAAVRAGQVWVAEEGGRLAGLLVLAEASGGLLLENIAVHPDAQRQGLGAGLLALAEREAARRGLAEIRLYTKRGDDREPAVLPTARLRGNRRFMINGKFAGGRTQAIVRRSRKLPVAERSPAG